MKDSLDLSVVIVSHNIVEMLRACLASLSEELKGMEAEVFVVDNASKDGTPEMVRDEFPWVSLVVSKVNLWFAAGNNAVLPKCRGRYVMLLNPDTLVHPNALKIMKTYLDSHAEVGAVGPTIWLPNGSIQHECARNLPTLGNLVPWVFQLNNLSEGVLKKIFPRRGGRSPAWNPFDRLNMLAWDRSQTCEVESLSGACMFIRREVIEQIGLIDESSLLYLDDIDYCQRIRAGGWSLHFVAEASIVHYYQQSTVKLSVKYRAMDEREGDYYAAVCHSIWMFLRKHKGSHQAAAFAAMAQAAAPLRIAVSLLAIAVTPASKRLFWERQLDMAQGLARWARAREKTFPERIARQKDVK